MTSRMSLLRGSASVLAILALPTAAFAGSLPADGKYVSGSGAIHSGANGMTIDQSSTRGIIDWQSFSIAKGKTVQFDNGKGATLNEVTGQNLSQIAGSLKATGSVFLVNPNGVIVTPTGKVFTQGNFAASSSANVTNEGSISSPNGQVSLISDSHGNVINGGNIAAAQVRLNAAGGNVYALAGNHGGVIRATGTANIAGHVWLTAGGTTTISGSVSAKNANGSGGTIIATGKSVVVGEKANLSASGTQGGIILIGGDIHGGKIAKDNLVAQQVATATTTSVARGARIDANGSQEKGGSVVVWSNDHTNFAGSVSARGGTAGGFTEVSSRDLLGFTGQVDLTAAFGKTGTLLLDPENVTISWLKTENETCSDGICTPTGGNSILNSKMLESLLATSSVEVTTGGSGSQTGDITVGGPLTWSSANTLTLDAYHSIIINRPVSIMGAGGLDLITDDGGTGGDLYFSKHGNVTFASLASSLTINGAPYTLVDNIAMLASDIAANANGNYALANSYDASVDGTYTSSPIAATFFGRFEGLGNAIRNLSIDDLTVGDDVGLFSTVGPGGVLRDIGLIDINVAGGDSSIGGLAGLVNGGAVDASYATGRVTMALAYKEYGYAIGGLVGSVDNGMISQSHARVWVQQNGGGEAFGVGGLVGEIDGGIVSQSYATGKVRGHDAAVGGLVGLNEGTLSDSFATGTVMGGGDLGYFSCFGGLVGLSGGAIDNSYASGAVTGIYMADIGGLVGIDEGTISNSYATGVATGGYHAEAVGGLVGFAQDATISQSYATGDVISDAVRKSIGAAGGLVGFLFDATISQSFATGAVMDTEGVPVGGLVGAGEAATISQSYATGKVTGGGGTQIGGFIGFFNGGTISESFATGAVTGGKNASVGGFVGDVYGTIDQSYATGAVVGGQRADVGGFAGANTDATISQSYATGAVTGRTKSTIGGFVGADDSDGSGITFSYWDTDTSGITNLSQGAGNIPNDPGITGLTTAQFQAGLPPGFDPSIWAESANINGGLPYLIANPPPGGGPTISGVQSGFSPAVWTGESIAKSKSRERRGNPGKNTERSVY